MCATTGRCAVGFWDSGRWRGSSHRRSWYGRSGGRQRRRFFSMRQSNRQLDKHCHTAIVSKEITLLSLFCSENSYSKELSGRLHGDDVAECFELLHVSPDRALTVVALKIVGTKLVIGEAIAHHV